MKAIIKKHPIAAYLLLTFVFSWGIFIPFLAASDSSMTVLTPISVAISLLIGLAPSLSAMAITAITEGGLKGSSLMAHYKLKNSWKSYAAVLLIMPVYVLLNVLLSDLFVTPYSVDFQPLMLVPILGWGLFSAFGEEFGWRGFLFPRMLKRRGLFSNILILGLIWAVWHIPMNYLCARSYGDYMIVSVLLSSVQLILDALIISQLYVIFKGSLKITILYHYTLTGMTILGSTVFHPAQFSYEADLRTNLIGFGIKTAIALIIFCTNRRKITEGLRAQSTTMTA